jgi:hypothetical protein
MVGWLDANPSLTTPIPQRADASPKHRRGLGIAVAVRSWA